MHLRETQPGQPILLSCVPTQEREKLHILTPQTPTHCQDQQTTQEHSRQADKKSKEGWRHSEFLPCSPAHLSSPKAKEKRARWQLWQGISVFCFVFNLQPNCVKCSQGKVRREIVVVALTHSSTARVAGGPHPSLASKGGQTAAAVLQEPPSSSRLGCLEAQLQKKAGLAARHRPAPRRQHAPGSSAGGS